MNVSFGARKVMDIAVLIPAFEPDNRLVGLVEALSASAVAAIVVINDGSGPQHDRYFQAVKSLPKVHLLEHAVNLGKGAALKFGINYALCAFPHHWGVVTADADGQHSPEDVFKVAQRLCAEPHKLVLGVRTFGKTVPFRSRLGNHLTSAVMYLSTGQRIADTQTGLRGIPHSLMQRLLRVPGTGYEFELGMLIICKHSSQPMVQENIQTIYIDRNSSSHFNPVLDSLRIYFTLFRFSIVSILTALLDNSIFYLMLNCSLGVGLAQIAGRLAAIAFNYPAGRKAVFLSQQRHRTVFPKYLLSVIGSGLISYALIRFLSSNLFLGVLPAKIIAESILFVFNFAVQRDFVFMRHEDQSTSTDWDRYYSATPATAKITRRYTGAVLLSTLERLKQIGRREIDLVAELGGANSCFIDGIVAGIKPTTYHVIDNNQFGLSLLKERRLECPDLVLHTRDVLASPIDLQVDVAFSVGLIEHFDQQGTRQAILAHFDILRAGGYAIISFPTPTLLYRTARWFAELLHLWNFPDERPLCREEVLKAISERGEVIYEKMLWPLVFTQRLIVARNARSI
jgi:putative flippase GtrA